MRIPGTPFSDVTPSTRDKLAEAELLLKAYRARYVRLLEEWHAVPTGAFSEIKDSDLDSQILAWFKNKTLV